MDEEFVPFVFEGDVEVQEFEDLKVLEFVEVEFDLLRAGFDPEASVVD